MCFGSVRLQPDHDRRRAYRPVGVVPRPRAGGF